MKRLVPLLLATTAASVSSAQAIFNVGGSYEMNAHADSGDYFENSPQSGPMPASDFVFANANDKASSSAEFNSGATAKGGLFANFTANAIVTAGESGVADAGGLAYFEFNLVDSTDLILTSSIYHVDDPSSWALVELDYFDGGMWREVISLQGNGDLTKTFNDLDGGLYRLYVGTKNSSSNDYAQTFAGATLNPVPEPATVAALGIGAACLMRRRKCRGRDSNPHGFDPNGV